MPTTTAAAAAWDRATNLVAVGQRNAVHVFEPSSVSASRSKIALPSAPQHLAFVPAGSSLAGSLLAATDADDATIWLRARPSGKRARDDAPVVANRWQGGVAWRAVGPHRLVAVRALDPAAKDAVPEHVLVAEDGATTTRTISQVRDRRL